MRSSHDQVFLQRSVEHGVALNGASAAVFYNESEIGAQNTFSVIVFAYPH